MCPFCRKCTYGYKTISGYRRHLNAAPIHHCHLRRIYEFAKMNCRSTELEPIDKWDNWTRRNVYVAYHGCEPPVNEIVLTPSPTKSAYVQNPEERTRLVHDEERRRKAVRSLAFVGKEGGTSVNDHNVMQRAVYLQVRRNLEHSKRYPEPEEIRPDETKEDGEQEKEAVTVAEKEGEKRVEEEEDMGDEDQEVLASPQLPMGSVPTEEPRKSRRLAVTSSSAASSPCKSPEPLPSTSSLPVTPIKNRRKVSSEERSVSHDDSPAPQTGDPRERLRQKLRDEQYAKMVAKRAQQVKRLISYKTFKKEQPVPKKPRKAMNYTVSVKSEGEDGHRSERHGEVDDEEYVTSTTTEQTIEPTTSSSIPTTRKSARCAKKVESFQNMEKARETSASPVKPKIPKEPEERPLKSMLARSFAAGVRPSMAKYQVPIDSFSTTISGRSLSSGAISSKSPRDSSSPEALGTISSSTGGNSVGGGLFARVLRAQAQDKAPAKRPTLLARRPLILSPRKKASTSLVNHESSPIIPSSAIEVVDEEILIYAKEMDVDVVEEEVITEATIDDVAATSSDNDKPVLTLAEALELKGDDGVVNNQELEEISKELMKDPGYYRSVEDAFKLRTATKIRADMRLSRHCMRQIEAARARARLFGEGNEDQYQIYYSNDGAQVVSKNDPKWRKLQQQQQFPGDEEEQE
uniref:Uncharacterized protein n=1 Tax=Caenorhabditis japonica TaxID=281687 RepID=A0A8R1DI40_CAEJA